MITTAATATDLNEAIAAEAAAAMRTSEVLNVSGRRFGRIATGQKSIWSYNPGEDFTLKSRIARKQRSKSCKPSLSSSASALSTAQLRSAQTIQKQQHELIMNQKLLRNRFIHDDDDDDNETENFFDNDDDFYPPINRTSATAEINNNTANRNSHLTSSSVNNNTNKLFFSNLFLSQLCGGGVGETRNSKKADFNTRRRRRRKLSRSFTSNNYINRQQQPIQNYPLLSSLSSIYQVSFWLI